MLQLYFHKCWTLYHGMLKLNNVERKQEWARFGSTRMTMERRTSTKMSLRSVKLYCVYFASINFSNVGQFSWSLILKDSIQSSSERETFTSPIKRRINKFHVSKYVHTGDRKNFWPVENLCVSVSLPNTTLTVRKFRRLAASNKTRSNFQPVRSNRRLSHSSPL